MWARLPPGFYRRTNQIRVCTCGLPSPEQAGDFSPAFANPSESTTTKARGVNVGMEPPSGFFMQAIEVPLSQSAQTFC